LDLALTCNSNSSPQQSPSQSRQPLYGPVLSIEDRQLPPLPSQPPAHQNSTFFHGFQSLLPQRADTLRHNEYQHVMTSSFQQSLPIRQLPYELPVANQPPRLAHQQPAPPLPITDSHSPDTPSRSAQSASPTATRRQRFRQGRRPQPVRSSSSSATQHVCTEPGCPWFDKVFSTFGNLQRHRREKHILDPQKYACPKGCGTTFTRTTARENHLKYDRCKPAIPGRRYDTNAEPSRRAGQW